MMPYGLTEQEWATILDATGAPDRDTAILQQMEAAVLEYDVFSVVTGEVVEPDHPDSLPRRLGMI